VKRFSRFLLILVVATLPLRGIAAAWGPPHSALASAPAEAVVAHEGCHQGMQDEGGSAPVSEAACGHCAACPVGAPALPGSLPVLSSELPGGLSIPFLDRRVRAHVPERLDRPPLSA